MPPAVVLCLVGDVMTGRGMDQILPTPGDPRLWERHVRDATTYVALAEGVSGRFGRPVDVAWPWGDALGTLEAEAPDARLINLETSVTTCDAALPGKAIHYRMNPANVGCLTVARPDACDAAVGIDQHLGHLGGLQQQAAVGGNVRAVPGRLDGARQPVLLGDQHRRAHVRRRRRLGDDRRPGVDPAARGRAMRVIGGLAGKVDGSAKRGAELF